MGKFDGILLVSDIDGTILDKAHNIGEKNRAAIRRFQAGGGRFTLATGRMPSSMAGFVTGIELNAPAICYNGASIFDHATGQTLWQRNLDEEAGQVLAHVESRYPDSGIELYSGERVWFCKINHLVAEHIATEHFPPADIGWREVPRPWIKAIFIQDHRHTEIIKQGLLASAFAERYQFVRSGDEFFELLPAGTSKGQALIELCRRLGQDLSRTIAVGDNENDVDMLKVAGLGIAVDNAAGHVKEQADRVTVHHEAHAIHQVIEELDRGLISL